MLWIYSEVDDYRPKEVPEFRPPWLVSGTGGTRDTAVLQTQTRDGMLVIRGKYDELLNLAANLASAVMSFPIVTKQENWFDSDESATAERVANAAGQDAGSSAGGADGGSGDDAGGGSV